MDLKKILGRMIFPRDDKPRMAVQISLSMMLGLLVGLFGFPTQVINPNFIECLMPTAQTQCSRYNPIRILQFVINTIFWYLINGIAFEGIMRWKKR